MVSAGHRAAMNKASCYLARGLAAEVGLRLDLTEGSRE